MTLNQFITILKARWRSGLLVLLITLGTALAASLMLPAKYTATASLVLDLRAADTVAGGMQGNLLAPGYLATQVDVIGSERVALRALRAQSLQNDSKLRDEWQQETKGAGDFEPWLVEQIQKRLEVRPSRESNVISISYTAPDRALAAGMANAFMQAYIDTSLELRVEPARQYNTFFDSRAKQLRDALESSQARLSAYQKQNGLLATDERLDVESARLSELSSQLVMIQALAAESSGRQSQTGTRADQMQEVLGDPVVAALSTDMAREESRIKELTARLGDSHPQVLQQRASISELRNRLAAATVRATGSVGVNASVNQSRVTQIRAALDAQRNKVLQLKGVRDEASVLQRDVENAQRAYDAMVSRVAQSGVESQNTQSNASVLKHASPPAFASSPKPLFNAAIALLLGLLLAAATMVVRELADRRLRTHEDVLTELKQPLLVTLPVAKHITQASQDTSRVRTIKARVLTGLPRPVTNS
jgi:polysaccharide biosynthesis transport protein